MYLASLPQFALAGLLASSALGLQVQPVAGLGLASRYAVSGFITSGLVVANFVSLFPYRAPSLP